MQMYTEWCVVRANRELEEDEDEDEEATDCYSGFRRKTARFYVSLLKTNVYVLSGDSCLLYSLLRFTPLKRMLEG